MKRAVTLGLLLGAWAVGPTQASAQDTTRAVLRLFYDNPKTRPALVVLPAPGLDSVRAILERDLEFSDRVELIPIPATVAAPGRGGINFGPYRAMNASLVLELLRGPLGITARLYDVGTGTVRNEGGFAVDLAGVGEGRLGIHRAADEVVQWVTGKPGIAASRILYVSDNRVWRVDSDGYGPTPLTPAGRTAYSPTWSPDGRRFAFTEYQEGKWLVVLQTVASGTRLIFPTTATTVNITPAFSGDGRRIAFSRVIDRTYALHQASVADLCCVQRLTTGRFAENLSPTYSPDGRRIAFVTNRAGTPQIYGMSADGTDQELLVPYEYGAGASFAPDWAPDGGAVAFHRESGGSFQVMIYDLVADRVRQLSSEGRNEDPSWGPDSRHVVFVSNRTGRGQLHIIDLETARVRQLRTPGTALLPAWSRRLGGTQ